jgi:hypothetical protein
MTVAKAPPNPIDEVPPDQQPEGENITWISGYWGWDSEEDDFIWISGIWRNVPPDRQWVPGYWLESDRKWQWISGYWEDGETEETVYVSQPPKTLERGPSSGAPSENHIWISGNWVNRDNDYAWQPGYWENGRQDWVWVPAHYRWTHRGYTYVNGYWDYEVERRGVVFAPVRFQPEVYTRPDYSYMPSAVISLAVFVDHLFVRPRASHYYFGDYYAPRYRDEGFYASFNYYTERSGYDPIYAHNRWVHRNERDWDRRRMEQFAYYRDNEQARPPRTFAAFAARPAGVRDGRPGGNYALAERLDRYAEKNPGGRRFQQVSADNRKRYIAQTKAVRSYSQERNKMESIAPRLAANQSARQKIQRSPVVGKRNSKAPARPKGEAAGKPKAEPKAGNSKPGRERPKATGPSGKRPNAAPDRKPPERENPGKDDKKQQPDRARETKPAPGERKDGPPRKANPSDKADKPDKPAAANKADAPTKPQGQQPARKPAERKTPDRKRNAEPAREKAAKPEVRKVAPAPRGKQTANPQPNKAPGGKEPNVREKTDEEGVPRGKP